MKKRGSKRLTEVLEGMERVLGHLTEKVLGLATNKKQLTPRPVPVRSN